MNRRFLLLFLLLPALLAAALAAPRGAQAHARDRMFSAWHVQGGTVTATLRLPIRLAISFGMEADAAKRLTTHFVRTMSVSRGGTACSPARTALSLGAADGTILLDLSWTCGSQGGKTGGKLIIRADALFGRFPNLVHFARLHLPGDRMDEYVFTDANRLLTVDLHTEAPREGRSWMGLLADYIGLGGTHILGGADHLAFVLGLMLLASGLRAMLFIVTGFTLGHSLTLALAATGTVAPVPAVVEALIGFTVAIVAAEAAGKASGRGLPATATTIPLAALALAAVTLGSALPAVTWAGLVVFTACYALLTRRAESGRWAVTLAAVFGLVHGFGFAGVLQQIGLPQGRQTAALLGFNLGVEAGQLIAVALAFAAGSAAARWMPEGMRPWAVHALASALCGLGTFWFVSRAFAG